MSSRRSVMKHQFSQIPSIKNERSSFDRSSGLKTTFDSGYLVPIFVDEVLPGDTFNLKMTGFARLATPLKPILDNVFMETFFFFCPTRLVWENWQKFNGERLNPDDSIDFIIPTFDTSGGGVAVDSIHDYMGVPPGITDLDFNALPARCYIKIYNDWFRDENLQDSVAEDIDDSAGLPGNARFALRRRGKRHDYFTSCLPWPQKGDSVELPLGISAPVVSEGTGIPLFDVAQLSNEPIKGINGQEGLELTNQPNSTESLVWADTALETDLSSATAATINSIRQAFQVQRLLERDARGGTRYTEIIRSHFGVTSPDHRLQRPEYLGGGSTQIGFTPIPQQTQPSSVTIDGNKNVGDLAAYATASLHNHGFSKSFTEHGYIIGLINVRADLTYQQGLPRMFSRLTRYDFFWGALSHLGEQSVLNKEIWADGSANDDLVFGYNERFSEYRYRQSQITSIMRSDNATPLDVWHLSQDFANLPVLDSDFIEENPPIQRIVAVQDEPEFLLDCYFALRCARPIPMYGTPGFIDHF